MPQTLPSRVFSSETLIAGLDLVQVKEETMGDLPSRSDDENEEDMELQIRALEAINVIVLFQPYHLKFVYSLDPCIKFWFSTMIYILF